MTKITALYSKHISLEAKMVEFAGYTMPLSYSGLVDEHLAVRNNAGIFDVSHMGEFLVSGKGALDLIQYVTSNDASILTPGRVQYSCLPNEKGGIVDDLLVYCLKENTFMLVVNASNIEKDWNWINAYNDSGVILHNKSDEYSLLAVQGPKATGILQKLTPLNLSSIPYYHFSNGKICNRDEVIISCTGYTGAGGFEIYCKNEDAVPIWDAIMDAGKDDGIKPAGLGARDTLRLEMGFMLYGNDINDETSPIEAGLGWITKFNKKFINCEQLLKQKEKGTERKLTGFRMMDRAIPRHGYDITMEDGTVIGTVTSGTQSPSLQQGIGLGYVRREYSGLGSTVYIKIRDKQYRAEVVKTPFYKPKS